MERYLFTYEDGNMQVYNGELKEEYIESSCNGYVIIVRMSDAHVLEPDGKTWTAIEVMN